MSPNLAVSVVIAAYNAAPTLDATLAALAAQTMSGDFEVLVADNGSTDDTRVIAERWADKLPLRVVDASARQGQAAARNTAVREAVGDLVVFTDADDFALDGWLDAWLSLAPQVEFATGPVVVFPADAQPPPRPGGVALGPPVHMGFRSYALGANLAVRRSVFTSMGGFDETMPPAEDVELSWRLQDSGVELVYVPSAVLAKRERGGTRHVIRQYYRYGLQDPVLYRRFRDQGVPRQAPAAILKSYVGLLLRLPLLMKTRHRVLWSRQVGRHAGRLVGSFRQRVFYP